MNSIFRKGMGLLTAGMAFVLLAACSSDNDSYGVPGIGNITRDMIVGEWYEPNGEGSYGVGEYKSDGTMISTTIYATKDQWLYTNNNGYWEFSDGLLTVVTNGDNSGLLNTNIKGVTRIIKLTKYEIEDSSIDMDYIEGAYRIVDTYRMNVGESRQVIVNDGDFVPQEYSTVNFHVASVDNEGNIEARHLGTTYILITSSIGTAVIRVVVNDSANDFDDTLQILGLPLKSVTKEYGQIYIERTQDDGITVRRYNLADEKVMQMKVITDTAGYVDRIEQFLSNYITPDEVRASFNRKYKYHSTSDGIDWYTTRWQFRMVAVGYEEEGHKTILYFMDGKNDLEAYDDFFNQVMNMNATIGLVADSMGYTLTTQDYYFRAFETDASYPFTKVVVWADEQGYVDKVRLYFDDYITFQDVEFFLKRFYLPTSYTNLYLNSEYTYFLGYEEGEDGYLKYFQYDKIKTE